MADEEVDFEEAVDLPDGDVAMDTAPAKGKGAAGRKVKGRGSMGGSGIPGQFESLDSKGSGRGPMKSIEGWIIFVTGLHEETQEDDIHDKFCDFGDIKNLHLNLDRRTGFVKGYALVEYESQKEAQGAIDEMNGEQIMGQAVAVDWAFSRGPIRASGGSRS
eukprot:1995595-Prymnesium_polylepis.2